MEAQVQVNTSPNTRGTNHTATTIWQNKVFVKMFAAYSLSTFGDWFDMIAIQVLLAYVWHTQPLVMALMPLTYALPGILLGQFAGILADRRMKRRLMIATDLLSAAMTGLLVYAPNVTLILVLLTLRSAAGTFYAPAQQALTRQVVAEEHLLKASTWNGMVNQMAKVLGPMGGALAISFFAPQLCLWMNVISFLLSALLLLSVRYQETISGDRAEHTSAQRFRDSWHEGWQVVLKSRVILASLIFGMIGLLGIQLVDTQFAVLFRELLPQNDQIVGWSISVVGFGSVFIIALLNRRLKEIKAYGWLFGGGYVGIGIGFAWLGLLAAGTGLLWTLFPGLVIGLGNGMFVVALNYLLQKEPPKEAVGRVSGILNTLTSAVVIIAPLLGGEMVTAFGASVSFLFVGVVVGIFGVLGLCLQRWIWGRRA